MFVLLDEVGVGRRNTRERRCCKNTKEAEGGNAHVCALGFPPQIPPKAKPSKVETQPRPADPRVGGFAGCKRETIETMITEAAAADTNVVLHVHRNHLDRVCDLLDRYREQSKADDVRADVLSTIRVVEGVRSNSLVFLRASDGKALVESLCNRFPFIWRGLNKV